MTACMRWKVLIAALLGLALVLDFAGVAAAQTPLDSEAREIASSLNCPVCQGESVEQSSATLAQEMRALITKRLQQGDSREEILQYFVDRYGEGILRDTPRSGFNLGLWVLPVLGLIVGFGVSVRAAYGRRSRRSVIASTEPSDLSGMSEEELARYERQLEEDLRP